MTQLYHKHNIMVLSTVSMPMNNDYYDNTVGNLASTLPNYNPSEGMPVKNSQRELGYSSVLFIELASLEEEGLAEEIFAAVEDVLERFNESE